MDAEIYLDANATSPVLPAAIAAAQAALQDDFGNPSSSHGAGLRARAILDAVAAAG
ncbi:MAG TPA: aminotransferase class V-fold PLP-dependent enzyme, partial [Massilia sp.]|nr:aminotransferase class V-fold PLP-dependent enzyme [Massilia sp.]